MRAYSYCIQVLIVFIFMPSMFIQIESFVLTSPIIRNSCCKSMRCMVVSGNLNWDPKTAPKLDFEEDYYSLLEVDEKSNQQELKRAYYKMVFKYHPDNKEGDSAKELANRQMMVINAAYKILKDVALRSEYDRKRFLKSTNTASSKSAPTTEQKTTRSGSSSGARGSSDSNRRPGSGSYRDVYYTSSASTASGVEEGDSLISILSEMWDDLSTNGVGNLLDDALSYFGADVNENREQSSIYGSLREVKELLVVQDVLIKRRNAIAQELREREERYRSANSIKTDRTVPEIEDLLNQIEEINGAKARLKEVNNQLKTVERKVSRLKKFRKSSDDQAPSSPDNSFSTYDEIKVQSSRSRDSNSSSRYDRAAAPFIPDPVDAALEELKRKMNKNN